jgi:hypothetical protein
MAAGFKREYVQRDFLKFTAQQMRFDLLNTNPQQLQAFAVGAKDRQYQFWKRNALSVDLYYHKTFLQKLNYIHNNPLQPKWLLASQAEDYRYSSAHFYHTGIDNWGFLTHYAD